MTQINFYTLASSEPQARLQFVCRLAEKALSLGHRIHIQTQSSEQAKELDALLWQFAPASFVPHALVDDKSANNDPVTLGNDLQAAEHAQVLINLAIEPCEATDRFSHINEVISADDSSLQRGRDCYRFYQGKSHPIETFKL